MVAEEESSTIRWGKLQLGTGSGPLQLDTEGANAGSNMSGSHTLGLSLVHACVPMPLCREASGRPMLERITELVNSIVHTVDPSVTLTPEDVVALIGVWGGTVGGDDVVVVRASN